MPFETPLSWVPNLEDAIECHPLTVAPETPLVDAIALMTQTHKRSCLLIEETPRLDPSTQPQIGNSSVLVMEEKAIVGILTERDLVRLTAKAINFQTATVADVMVYPVVTLPEQSVQDIFAALFLFRRYRIRHLPIVNDQGELIGVLSHESIRKVLRPANLLRFRRVSDVMTTLLRVFDPMEMYGVIENLQQTLQQIKAKETEELPSNPSFPNPTQNPSPSLTAVVCDRKILPETARRLTPTR